MENEKKNWATESVKKFNCKFDLSETEKIAEYEKLLRDDSVKRGIDELFIIKVHDMSENYVTIGIVCVEDPKKNNLLKSEVEA